MAQLLAEELTGLPFAEHMRAEVLEPLGLTASSFRWSRTAETARPHDAAGGPLPDFIFAEQAAAAIGLAKRRPTPRKPGKASG